MNNTAIKSYDILKLRSQHSDGLTLSQIVKALELPQSSVFNMVHALEALGMLRITEGPVPACQIGIETGGTTVHAAINDHLRETLCHD